MGKLTKLKKTNSAPSGRSAPQISVLDDYIYLFGGLKDDFNKKLNTVYNDLYRFDTRSNAWEELKPKGDLPPARGFGVAVGDKINDRILVFAGTNYSYDYSHIEMYDDLWAYSPSQNTWTKIQPENQGPCARGKPTTWIDGENMYVFGGATGGLNSFTFLNDVWVYNLKTNQWTELASNDNTKNAPLPRDEAVGGLSPEGNLIIYGGETYFKDKNSFPVLNDTWEFNLKTNKWKHITPSPENNISPPRNFASSAVIGNFMYVHGGAMAGLGSIENVKCGAVFNQRSLTDELWRFDLINHVWTKLGVSGNALPRMKRTVAASVKNKMYIFSGWDFQWFGGTPSADLYGDGPGQIWNEDVYIFDPDTIAYGDDPDQIWNKDLHLFDPETMK